MNRLAIRILVLTEGAAPYVTEADVAEFAGYLRNADKVRFWIIGYFSPRAIRAGQKARARFMRNTPLLFAPNDWFGFFDLHCWHAREVRCISEEAERLGMPIPLPLALGEAGRSVHPARSPRADEAVCGVCASDPEMGCGIC